MTNTQREYQAGLDAGLSDLAGCNDMSDWHWKQGAVIGNLGTTRPDYVRGYVNAIHTERVR